jgi:hypothetical protein
MIVGLAMVIAGLPPSGAAEDAHVAIAATDTVAEALDSPRTRLMARQSPWGMAWQGSSDEAIREEHHRHGKRFRESGALRTFLLQSAAVAHRRSLIAEAVPPDFS